MPTQAFDDTEIVQMVNVLNASRQKSQNEEFEHQGETFALEIENESDIKKCKTTIARRRRKGKKWLIVSNVCLTIIVCGLIGWVIWLTLAMIDIKRMNLPKQEYKEKCTEGTIEYEDLDTKQNVYGIRMQIDVNSLLESDDVILKYKTTSTEVNMRDGGIEYQPDGSFRILKSGRYILHSKLSLTNNDFEISRSFRHCLVLADDKSECEQATVPPTMRQTSKIWRVDYLKENQIVKVAMTNKGLVDRNPIFSKIEIVEYIRKY